MQARKQDLTLEAFALRVGIAGFCAVVTAVIILGTLVTPADRGGGPIFANWVLPELERAGIWSASKKLKGESPLAAATAVETVSVKPRFIVRFDNNPGAEKALRLFRENRSEGRTAFADWAAKDEAFSEFRLASVTPAGEAVLVYQGKIKPARQDLQLRELTTMIIAAPGVAYVDPYSFYPNTEKAG